MGRTRKLKSSPLSPSLSLSSPFKFEFMWAQEEAWLAVEIYIVREGRLPAHISLWVGPPKVARICCVCVSFSSFSFHLWNSSAAMRKEKQ